MPRSTPTAFAADTAQQERLAPIRAPAADSNGHTHAHHHDSVNSGPGSPVSPLSARAASIRDCFECKVCSCGAASVLRFGTV